MDLPTFKKLISHDGKRLFRDMPWRESLPDGSYDPYRILVSEVMLQQTQVPRVIPKFIAFIAVFPTVKSLAVAPLSDVLKLWSGLGYNRRAKYLHDAAQHLLNAAKPWSYDDLIACKGIGPNTAKAVIVYTYDRPEIFIETNIRTVFIHYFFKDKPAVSDKEILELHQHSLDSCNPRSCYWALMDIGAYIKSTTGNANTKSNTYKKQSKFEGSLRQHRGRVLKQLSDGPKKLDQLQAENDPRLISVLEQLEAEGLIHKSRSNYLIGNR